jgi:hypothetical protein
MAVRSPNYQKRDFVAFTTSQHPARCRLHFARPLMPLAGDQAIITRRK